jgi:hypothetical protein
MIGKSRNTSTSFRYEQKQNVKMAVVGVVGSCLAGREVVRSCPRRADLFEGGHEAAIGHQHLFRVIRHSAGREDGDEGIESAGDISAQLKSINGSLDFTDSKLPRPVKLPLLHTH